MDLQSRVNSWLADVHHSSAFPEAQVSCPPADCHPVPFSPSQPSSPTTQHLKLPSRKRVYDLAFDMDPEDTPPSEDRRTPTLDLSSRLILTPTSRKTGSRSLSPTYKQPALYHSAWFSILSIRHQLIIAIIGR